MRFFVLLLNFSLIWRRHHCQGRVANFDLCSALMAIEQWGFISMPHILRHRASICNGHLWWPVTLTLIAEHLAVELSLPFVFWLSSIVAWIRTPNLPLVRGTLLLTAPPPRQFIIDIINQRLRKFSFFILLEYWPDKYLSASNWMLSIWMLFKSTDV